MNSYKQKAMLRESRMAKDYASGLECAIQTKLTDSKKYVETFDKSLEDSNALFRTLEQLVGEASRVGALDTVFLENFQSVIGATQVANEEMAVLNRELFEALTDIEAMNTELAIALQNKKPRF